MTNCYCLIYPKTKILKNGLKSVSNCVGQSTYLSANIGTDRFLNPGRETNRKRWGNLTAIYQKE